MNLSCLGPLLVLLPLVGCAACGPGTMPGEVDAPQEDGGSGGSGDAGTGSTGGTGVTTPVTLSLALKNAASGPRECLLYFERRGVRTTLFSGTLQAGEERDFPKVFVAPPPFYVDTGGGCRKAVEEFGSGFRPMGLTVEYSLDLNTICRFEYHEPTAVFIPCW